MKMKTGSKTRTSGSTAVLVAEGVEFRVYRGPLVDHSSVFKDLFSQREEDGEDGGLNAHSNAALNEHANASSNADPNSDAGPDTNSDSGCPTVELTDSADDLRHILRVFLPNRDPACVTPCVPGAYTYVLSSPQAVHLREPLLRRVIRLDPARDQVPDVAARPTHARVPQGLLS